MSEPRTAIRDRFLTTRWSIVRRAAGISGTSRAALASLCEAYWYPVYAFIRRQGHAADEARDLTQAFFAQLIAKRSFRNADPARGRFRAFLAGAIRHFLANERRRARSARRAWGRVRTHPLALDTAEERYAREPHDAVTPERLFDRKWALVLLDRAMARVREQYARAGNLSVFLRLQPYLIPGGADLPYATLADSVGSTEPAIKVAIHRLRRRFRDALIDEIALTVPTAEDVDGEIRYLLAAVSRPRNVSDP
jgi:RNA polymerase sigma-70 factor (ECF subfamily)